MTTAQIIQLPSAAAERVIQTKKCGRHPKSILLFWKGRRERENADYDKREIAEEIERVKSQLVMTDRMKAGELKQLERLSRPNMSPAERHQLAVEIFHNNPSLEAQEALRAAKGQP